ncbi:putative BPI/LBP family protein At1g04970 isoform X1 [Gossypium arboreum]|uniref:putative BPI/LBP family protein At1g04970 isoform X1 n=1 Tax=Gossypium arboreum TaxID=29729 RepID=UPI000819686E|nr:putative BPI/LBP family protein At1g04970 isoform X1 [Gossypium arboreum]
MKWKYSYKAWIVTISDQGTATVEVLGMVVWLKATVINEEGTLKLFLSDYECHVKDISISVDGGASWLYQGFYLPLTVQICIDDRTSRHGYCSFTLVCLCERTYCEQMEVIFVHATKLGC